MRKEEPVIYQTPSEQLKFNRKQLADYAGEWIAFTNSGVIAHHKSGKIVAQEAKATLQKYALKYVHSLEIPRIIRIVPVRIRSLKNKKWSPDYLIELSSSSATEELTMLVDSGADITIIPKWTGEDLLLGRENVFDLFDIEFKQADETILFKWRGENS